ncbi:MAG: sigma 54-interacting transcriptional regulator, partial [Bilophila wadsworthia]
DCTTLPVTLVEAHLFGHARGAFTGADRAREGLLAAADHGTLFLDEVGELPLPVQGAFLRALELRRFRPVGEVREVESDFRLVAATNRDLDDMVGMDLYRSDLRFRLRGMTIHVPPLRRRVEDIPLLAEHFTARYCQRHELPNKELTPDDAMLADRVATCANCATPSNGPAQRGGRNAVYRHLPRNRIERPANGGTSPSQERRPPLSRNKNPPRSPGRTHPARHDQPGDYIAGCSAVGRRPPPPGCRRFCGHFYELLKNTGWTGRLPFGIPGHLTPGTEEH